MESMKEEYLRFWKGILGVMLGWTSEQVEQWAHKWDPHGIDDEDSMFYHELPTYYVGRLIIPQSILGQLDSTTYLKLWKKVLHALDYDETGKQVSMECDTLVQNNSWVG
jgi:hypothetical protein